jgi:hypothetical protein
MDIHNSNYKEMREAKQARYQELAEKNRELADEQFKEAIKMGEVIPFGQPILVGHHSEKGDRNYRKKIDNKMRKSFETNDKAKHYESKAKSMGHSRAISRDDPEAVTKLKAKIEVEKKTHAAAKSKRKDFRDRKVELIKELGDREYHLKYYLLEAHMTGATAEIKRCEGRISEIQALEKIPDIDETINGIRLYTEEARIRIDFGFKPEEETRTKLKRHNFKWSPYNQVWQNFIKQNNIDFARELLQSLKD